jgi:hypothetical protein
MNNNNCEWIGKEAVVAQTRYYFVICLEQLYSTFLVRVPQDVISLQIRIPSVVGV